MPESKDEKFIASVEDLEQIAGSALALKPESISQLNQQPPLTELKDILSEEETEFTQGSNQIEPEKKSD